MAEKEIIKTTMELIELKRKKMNKQQFLKNYKGKKARITGDHPHSGCIAECIGVEITSIGLGVKFKRTDSPSEEFFVFDGNLVNFL